MKREIQLNGAAIPYKTSQGQVIINGEKLNQIIVDSFGKDPATVEIAISIKEMSPQLVVVDHNSFAPVRCEEPKLPFTEENVCPAYESNEYQEGETDGQA